MKVSGAPDVKYKIKWTHAPMTNDAGPLEAKSYLGRKQDRIKAPTRMREGKNKVCPFSYPYSLIVQENFPPLADGAQKLYPSGTPTTWK